MYVYSFSVWSGGVWFDCGTPPGDRNAAECSPCSEGVSGVAGKGHRH